MFTHARHMSDHLPESSLAPILAEQGAYLVHMCKTPTCPTTSQNPLGHPTWLNKACTTRKDSESEWLAKDNPETKPITIKPETASHVTELLSWVPLPSCSPPGCPFPVKSLALSAHVSPRTIHFRGLDKSPVSGPGRGPPSCYIVTAQTLSTLASFAIRSQGPDSPKMNSSVGRK